MNLETLKNNYAKEQGYEDWDSLWHAHIHKLLDFEIIMNDICIRAQKAKEIDISEAEKWLGEEKDIWNHPYISNRNNTNAYELAELLTDFANYTNEKNLIL